MIIQAVVSCVSKVYILRSRLIFYFLRFLQNICANTLLIVEEGPKQRRSKLKEREQKKYQELQNESTVMKDSRLNETDDIVEMHELAGGLMFNPKKNIQIKKLPPTTSKLYNSKANQAINSGLQEEEKTPGTSTSAPQSKTSVSMRTNANLGRDEESKGNNFGPPSDNRSTESDKEFERRREFEDQERLKTNYYLRNIFIQGSLLQNFIWIDSFINPRHVRWSLWFTNIVFIWYFCAVVFNNSRDPKKVPDFDRKTRELTFDEIWISIAAPWAAMIFVYIFCIIMKVSNNRIRYTRTVKYLDYIIDEYRREHVLRYLMGYFIIFTVNGMVFLYLVQFTSIHGWKTSWIWWNTGSLGLFINTVIYDPVCALLHWAINK